MYGLGNVYSPDIIKCTVNAINLAFIVTPPMAIYGFYSFVTAMTAVATRRIIKHEKLTKFQIFSMIVFPIITIPFFIALILKPEILEGILYANDMLIAMFFPWL